MHTKCNVPTRRPSMLNRNLDLATRGQELSPDKSYEVASFKHKIISRQKNIYYIPHILYSNIYIIFPSAFRARASLASPSHLFSLWRRNSFQARESRDLSRRRRAFQKSRRTRAIAKGRCGPPFPPRDASRRDASSKEMPLCARAPELSGVHTGAARRGRTKA